MVGNFFTYKKLDSDDYDTTCQKIQFLLKKHEVLKHS